MKKLFSLLLIAYCLLLTSTFVFAQEEDATPTPAKKTSSTPTPDEEKTKIDDLKEKIASTVAQLNLVSKKAVIGEITKIEKNMLTLEYTGENKIIEVDELTVYTELLNNKRTDIEFGDLDVGDTIVALGLYNKDSRRLLARFVLVKTLPVHINGIVKEVDIKGGTISVEDKKDGIFTIGPCFQKVSNLIT